MSSSAVFDAIAPALKDDPDVETFLTLAGQQLSASVWGILFEQGASYLAAHMMTLRDRAVAAADFSGGAVGGGAGPVSSMSEGGLSVSWAGVSSGSASSRENELASTTFGARLIDLESKLVTTPVVVGETIA